MRGATLGALGTLFAASAAGHGAMALAAAGGVAGPTPETALHAREARLLEREDALVRREVAASQAQAEAPPAPPDKTPDGGLDTARARRLAALYAAVPPAKAAAMLGALPPEAAAAVVALMPPHAAGAVLTVMPTEAAAPLAAALAG